jgi:phage-related protein
MKRVYTAFSFGSYTSSANDVLNVTLDADMYDEALRGSRSIIEDKVQGVEAPYFFYVDDEPLAFEVNFAFEEKTKAEIKTLMRALISKTGYTPLSFGNIVNNSYSRQSPIYNVIFTDEPELSFIGTTVGGVLKYNGYFTLKARCDRPYGYETFTNVAVSTTQNTTLAFSGDVEVYPNITIQANASENVVNFSLKSYTNANFTGPVISQIGFSLIGQNEKLTINGNLFTILSNVSQSTVYLRWNRNNFKLFPGNNYLVVEFSGAAAADVSVKLDYEAPTFIKE